MHDLGCAQGSTVIGRQITSSKSAVSSTDASDDASDSDSNLQLMQQLPSRVYTDVRRLASYPVPENNFLIPGVLIDDHRGHFGVSTGSMGSDMYLVGRTPRQP